MSRTTPRIVAGTLSAGNDGARIALDSPAWFAWLADDAQHSFHFTHPCGNFTARKERKQRGHWYWVAYRQVRGILYKTYLGKSATLTHAHLCAAAATLRHLADAAQAVPPGPAADP